MADDADRKRRLVEEAFDESAATYADDPIFYEPGRLLIEAASMKEGDRVLDIATGRGAVLFPAADRVGKDGFVHGIDIASEMVLETEKDLQARGVSNARVTKMDAEHLSFDDASFDVVTCSFGLWFIPDLQGALSEIRRVLRPGGRFAASTWGKRADFHQQWGAILASYGAGAIGLGSHDLSSSESLSQVLEAAGFTGIEVQPFDRERHFRNAQEWWDVMGSIPQSLHGMTESQVAEARHRGEELFEAFASVEGIKFGRPAWIVSATSP